MTATQPQPGIPWAQFAAPLALIGVLAAGAGIISTTWMAATLAATDPAAPAPGWGSATAKAVLAAGGAGSLDPLIGPAGSRPLFWTVLVLAGIVLAAATVAATVTWGLRTTTRTQRPPTALTRNALPGMRGPAAHQRATDLRPSLRQQ